jgi:osmotically-inducible protein OsmY
VKSDRQIQQDVISELQWDSRVDATRVGVEVDGSVVTLSGDVSDYVKKMAAQDAAHRVAGVHDVVNHIQVHLPGSIQRTDTDVAQAVRHALEWDVVVPDEQIQSTVADGWVTLEGEVDTWHERDAADRAVRHLTGIRGVINKLEVNLPYVRTDDIRDEIEHALERRAERHANRIQIDVFGNTVRLSGRVASWPEREAVVGAARGTPGVRTVEDQLTIDPSALPTPL